MSLFPCSICRARTPGKLASVTYAWWRADNKRTAWRQKLCVGCYVQYVLPLAQSAQDAPEGCPGCHTNAGDAMDPVYITAFVPGAGRQRLELATCGACAVAIRSRGQENAVHLEDQQPEFGGLDPGPQTDPWLDAWQSLGIDPRD